MGPNEKISVAHVGLRSLWAEIHGESWLNLTDETSPEKMQDQTRVVVRRERLVEFVTSHCF